MRPAFVSWRGLSDFSMRAASARELLAREDAPRKTEHVPFLFLDVVLDVFLQDLELRAPRLVVCGNSWSSLTIGSAT